MKKINRFVSLSILIFISLSILISPLLTIQDNDQIWENNFEISSQISYEVNYNHSLAGLVTYSYNTIDIDSNTAFFVKEEINGSKTEIEIDITTGKLAGTNLESLMLKDVSKFSISSSLTYPFESGTERKYKIIEKNTIDGIWLKNITHNILVSLPIWVLESEDSDTKYEYYDIIYLSQITGTLLFRNFTQSNKENGIIWFEFYRVINFKGIDLQDDDYEFNKGEEVVQSTSGFELVTLVVFMALNVIIIKFRNRK